MKRLFDILASLIGLIVVVPIMLPMIWLVWRQDGHSPFYIAPRVGKNGDTFWIVKLRSMVWNADKTGVDSTAATDPRTTRAGRFIRHYKLDELPQLWNVLTGDMSLVGPRPNVKRETALYSDEELELLSVAPGITDIASIVFSDEAAILEGRPDPDVAYNQLIRPYKSRLGLLYVRNSTAWLDLQLLGLTLLNAVGRRWVLQQLSRIVASLGGSPELVLVARREHPLRPAPPPGLNAIVTSRHMPSGL